MDVIQAVNENVALRYVCKLLEDVIRGRDWDLLRWTFAFRSKSKIKTKYDQR